MIKNLTGPESAEAMDLDFLKRFSVKMEAIAKDCVL